jgi:two-component system cell cycle sensor histidine kinase/response regulator CckA
MALDPDLSPSLTESHPLHHEDAGEILGLLAEHSEDAIYILVDGRFPFINRKFRNLFHVDPAKVAAEGFNFMDLVALRSHPMLRERAERIAHGESVAPRYEFWARTPDGQELEVETSTARVTYRGRPATLGIVRDITERKQAERLLRESQERLEQIIHNLPIVLWAVDTDGIFTLSEGRGLRVLGLEPGEVVGRSVYEIYRDYPDVERNIRKCLEGDQLRDLMRIGENVWETYFSTIRNPEGEIVGVLGVSSDVTEQLALQNQLRQSQKMEAIGRLAGGIAHDFNNVLMVVLGNSELARHGIPEGEPILRRLEAIDKAARHAQELTGRLLAFSRKQLTSPRVVDLNEVLRGVHPMLERVLGEDVTLVTSLTPGLASVQIDPAQVEQVLLNLIVNARDAMPDGGTIRVSTALMDVDEAYCRTHPYVASGTYLQLEVADDGIGMSPEIQERIFEPFFTTKATGSGLGLATVYGIVKQAGCSIEVESAPGEGTRFIILIPETGAVPEPMKNHPEEDSLPVGRELVLLVEDDDNVRELAVEMLIGLGYTVRSFPGAQEAIGHCRDTGEEYDLLLTDVVMPDLSGRDLVAALRPDHPNLRVLFMSGYTADAIARHGVLNPGVLLLNKPFTIADLARRVRDAIES